MTRPIGTFRTAHLPEAPESFREATSNISTALLTLAPEVAHFHSATMLTVFGHSTVLLHTEGEAPRLLCKIRGVAYVLHLPRGTADETDAVESAVAAVNDYCRSSFEGHEQDSIERALRREMYR